MDKIIGFGNSLQNQFAQVQTYTIGHRTVKIDNKISEGKQL